MFGEGRNVSANGRVPVTLAWAAQDRGSQQATFIFLQVEARRLQAFFLQKAIPDVDAPDLVQDCILDRWQEHNCVDEGRWDALSPTMCITDSRRGAAPVPGAPQ